MLHHYEDYSYEYADEGNHGYNDYKNDYKSYLNHIESDHGNPEPTPSELNDTNYGDTTPLEYEANETTNDGYKSDNVEYEDIEVNGEVYNLAELADAINSGEYEPCELAQNHFGYGP
jgi:hypothetical protein